MRLNLKAVQIGGILLLSTLASLFLITQAGAQVGAKSERGGILAKAGSHTFEVFFYPTGVRVFPVDAAGKPVDTSKSSALAIFYHPSTEAPWFSRTLVPGPLGTGQVSTSLDDSISLVNVPATGAKAVFEVSGLAGPTAPAVSFTIPIEFVKVAEAAAPTAESTPTTPFVYTLGAQGFGYYANPGPQAAPAAVATPRFSGNAAAAAPGRAVGPGARDWSTGRNGRLHKPWLQSR